MICANKRNAYNFRRRHSYNRSLLKTDVHRIIGHQNIIGISVNDSVEKSAENLAGRLADYDKSETLNIVFGQRDEEIRSNVIEVGKVMRFRRFEILS